MLFILFQIPPLIEVSLFTLYNSRNQTSFAKELLTISQRVFKKMNQSIKTVTDESSVFRQNIFI